MNLPFEYDRVAVGEFGGTTPTTTNFEKARVVILPIPLDRTTSYVPGTRNGPHEILVASSHMELWDEETETDVHTVGIFTMPEMDFPFASMDDVVKAIRRVATEIVSRDKFLLALGEFLQFAESFIDFLRVLLLLFAFLDGFVLVPSAMRSGPCLPAGAASPVRAATNTIGGRRPGGRPYPAATTRPRRPAG